MSRCVECVRAVDKEKYRTSASRNGARRERQTGWASLEFDMAVIMQRGLCAVCRDPMDPPHSDHCHTTGQTRALLCGPCNKALGLFKDEPERMRAAADYVERHRALHDNPRKHRRGMADVEE